MDFEIHGPIAVYHQVLLSIRRRIVNTIHLALEQVHRRSRMKPDMACIQRILERRLTVGEQQQQFHFVAADLRHGRLEAVHANEVEALREREILLQQPVSLEAGPRHRQEGIFVVQTAVADHRGRQNNWLVAGAQPAHHRSTVPGDHLLEQQRGNIRWRLEMEGQVLQGKLVQRDTDGRGQLESQGRPARRTPWQFQRRQRAGAGKVTDLAHLQRP